MFGKLVEHSSLVMTFNARFNSGTLNIPAPTNSLINNKGSALLLMR